MKRMLAILVAGLTVALPTFALAAEPAATPKLVESRKIWDTAPHNAFTGLVRFKDKWFCAFREGQTHVAADGKLRILTSADGATWESAALITGKQGDLRDAKICVTPGGKLMLLGAVALPKPSAVRHRSLVWFSDDGKTWTDEQAVGDENYWIWRVTFHDGVGYGIGYRTDGKPANQTAGTRLYVTKDDGKSFQASVADLGVSGWANEHDMVFQPDGTAVCLLRRDVPPKSVLNDPAVNLPAVAKAGHALLGTAKAPYTEWTWKDLNCQAGGPALLRLEDGRIAAVVRLYDKKVRTSLCWLDPTAATLTEALTLPSGGDCSYAGLVWREGLLWVSYYSSHESKKTSIYLAKVDVGGK